MRRRIFILMCIFLFIFTGLLAKISYYQIVQGYEIAKRAAAMRSREIELKEYSRGQILDRNYLPLTDIWTAKAVYCLPRQIAKTKPKISNKSQDTNDVREEFKDVAETLGTIIKDADSKEILACLDNAYKSGIPFVRVASELSDSEAALINSSQLSGIVVAPIAKRYREDGFCAHLIGYTVGKNPGEGKTGLEKKYDDFLKQKHSSQELISVFDARGLAIQGLMFKVKNEQEKQNKAVVLTIDKRVQEVIEKVMNEKVKKGAVVVMDVHSREILSMASRPSFNPYQVEHIIEHDQESSLINRALSRYHPGSLFKIVVAAAALEDKLVTMNDEFNCKGEYIFNDKVSISCWKEEGHGTINFGEGFAYSCNPLFIQTGLKLGRSTLLEYVNRLHLCDETLIGYDYHAGSYVKINPGEPALGNACLGQQGVMLTPVQITSLAATVVDDGYWAPPSLVKYTVDSEEQGLHFSKKEKERVLSRETASKLQKMLEMVVEQGTGKTAALAEVKVAGKTATSQTGRFADDEQEELNAWFVGYLPVDNPRWVIVIFVEDGKSGAQDAAPVFKDIAGGMLKLFSINDKITD